MSNERLPHPAGELRSLLQANDPLDDGRAPSPEQIAAARREVLAAARPAPALRRLVPAFLIPAAALLALAVGLDLWRDLPSPTVLPEAHPAEQGVKSADANAPVDVRGPRGTRLLFFPGPPAPALPQEREDRRLLHLQTPGGTRIVWTLNRDFEG